MFDQSKCEIQTEELLKCDWCDSRLFRLTDFVQIKNNIAK